MMWGEASLEPVLKAEGLRFSVGDAVTVGPIDLEVPELGAFGVVGESGSGKSLLCRTLLGMLFTIGGRIDEGSLGFKGMQLAQADQATWRKVRRGGITYIPQASLAGLNPVRRVGSQVFETLKAIGIRDRRARRDRALELFDQVRLRDARRVLRSYPHELSGGMRQRVMLALALALDPRLLVADEPTTAIDATVQSEILDLLGELRSSRSMSLILVSHDVGVVRRVCRSIAVMYAGRFMEVGPISEVMSKPAHPYTEGLLASAPSLTEHGRELRSIGGVPPPPRQWHVGGCPFAPRCNRADELCRREDPALETVSADRSVRCHRWRDVVSS